MAEDYHGLIALPSPSVAVGDVTGRRRTGFGSMTRVAKMQDLPPVLSAWGMGGPSLAQGLSHSAKVFEQMEIDRQQIEATQVQDEFMDAEREQLRTMMERKGQGAVNSVADMNAFYEEQGRHVLSKARGTYQQGLYENFMKQRRATGLNAATNHEISEHENYKKEFLQGQADRMDREIAANPEAGFRLADEYDKINRRLNPDREPSLADAISQKTRDDSTLKGILSLVDQGRFDEAEALKRRWDYGGSESGGGYTLPVDGKMFINSGFGPRNRPNAKASADHKGLDISVTTGTQVKSTSGGVVEFAGTRGNYGTTVMVRQDDGTTALYAHLSKAGVAVGARVEAGDIVALSGNSGNSTGPHLHYELRDENGKAFNPSERLGLTKHKGTSAMTDPFVAVSSPQGLEEKGNIDLTSRPVTKTDDGKIITVRSMSINIEGQEVLIPTNTDAGELLNKDEAVKQYLNTGKHLGKFKTSSDATAYGKALSKQQSEMYSMDAKRSKVSTNPELSMQMDNIIKNGRNQFAAANKSGVKSFIDQIKNHVSGILEGGLGFEGYEDTFRNLIATGQIDEVAGQQALVEFQEARVVYKATRSDEGQFMSLPEGSAMLAEAYPRPADLMPGEAETPERVAAMAAWMRTQNMIDQQKAAFDASPFDFVAKAADKTYQAMVDQGTITGNETEDRITAQRAAAQRKGGFNNTQASQLPVTTLQERNNINAQYNSLESISDKTEWYNEMSAKYGKYWPQAMADANIGFGIAIAAQIPTNNPQLRAAALMADSKKLSDYDLTDVDAKNLKALVTTTLNKDEGYFGVINAIAASRFDDEGMVTMRDNIRDTVTKMAAHYRSEGLNSKDALAKVMDAFKQMAPANIIDDDLANLSIPKEYNQYTITKGLLSIKEAMGAMWDFDPESGEQWQGSTFFRNHEDGIIWDSPGNVGLFFTWEEANEIGRRASVRQRVGRGQILSGQEVSLKGPAKSALSDTTSWVNAKLAEGSAKPDPVAQVGMLPSREQKALAEKTKKAAKEKVL